MAHSKGFTDVNVTKALRTEVWGHARKSARGTQCPETRHRRSLHQPQGSRAQGEDAVVRAQRDSTGGVAAKQCSQGQNHSGSLRSPPRARTQPEPEGQTAERGSPQRSAWGQGRGDRTDGLEGGGMCRTTSPPIPGLAHLRATTVHWTSWSESIRTCT